MQVELQWALLQDLAAQDRPDVVTRRPVQQASGRSGDPQSHGRATADCARLVQQRAGRSCGARLQAGSPRSQRGPGAGGTCGAAKPRAHSACRTAWVARWRPPCECPCVGSVLGVSWERLGGSWEGWALAPGGSRWERIAEGGAHCVEESDSGVDCLTSHPREGLPAPNQKRPPDMVNAHTRAARGEGHTRRGPHEQRTTRGDETNLRPRGNGAADPHVCARSSRAMQRLRHVGTRHAGRRAAVDGPARCDDRGIGVRCLEECCTEGTTKLRIKREMADSSCFARARQSVLSTPTKVGGSIDLDQ